MSRRILITVAVPLLAIAWVFGALLAMIWFCQAILIGWAHWQGEYAVIVACILTVAMWIGGPALAAEVWSTTEEKK